MHGVPVMALTGTATLAMVNEITQILGMNEFVRVKATSNRPNIMLTVEKMETLPDEEIEKRAQLMDHLFGEVICDLNNNGKKASKVIVFCFLRNDCAMIYEYFLQNLGNHALVNMYTNITDEISKKSIVTQFCTLESELRVVIATVAFGMGINCPDVCKVIHFRSPSTLLNYGQEAGRCGRDGRQAQAKLFYSNKEFGICLSKFNKKKAKYQSEICELQKMKQYATNTAECRRVLLLNYLDGGAAAKREIENSNVARHNCCDICASTCECEDCLLIEAMDSMEIEEEVSTSIPGSRCCRFTNEQKQVIKSQLIHLRASLSEDTCLLSPDHSFGFTTHVINQIVENCESLKTEDDVFEQVDVWNPSLAQEILTILSNVEE